MEPRNDRRLCKGLNGRPDPRHSTSGLALQRAKARGVRFGRKLKLTRHQILEALTRREAGEALTEIGRTFGVSHSTISRLRGEALTGTKFYCVMNFCATTVLRQPIFVRGLFDGQGYLFNSDGRCYVITALHVLETPNSQSVSPTIHLEFGNVQYDGPVNPPSNLPSNWIKPWRYPSLDVALVEVGGDFSNSLCARIPRRRLNDAPAQDQLIFARSTGAIEYVPIEVTDSNSSKILIKDFWTLSPAAGRSGSLAISHGTTILGFLESTSDSCSGQVTPIDTINEAFRSQARVHLPMHSRLAELVEAAFQAEQTFVALLNVIDDPNTVDGSGESPLGAVASSREPRSFVRDQTNCISRMNSRLRIAGQILKRGGRVDGEGGNSWTPLIVSVWDGESFCTNGSMIEFLLSNNAAANQIYKSESSFKTVLHYAVEQGSVDAVRILLKYHANANVRDRWGNTPIMELILNDPTGPGVSSGCDDSDNVPVKKFKLLAKQSDLSLQMQDQEFGSTPRQALQRRASRGGTPGMQRCFQRMLDAIAN